VIGRARRFARSQIHIDFSTQVRQRSGGQDVIDPPAPIVLKGAPEVVPVRVLDAIRVEFAEDVDETLVARCLVGIPRIDVEVDVIHAAVGMVHVDRLGRDV